ncbi:MAG: holo-ACP synthase [bacterium]|nr:holo-ACP synthase [bacterium]
MRLYQGVDLVEIDRFREAYDRHEAFGNGLFTEAEVAYCHARPDPYPHLAARFAAKEACMKAFGVGMGGFGATGRFQEIEVESAPSGKPTIRLHGSMEKMGQRYRIRQLTISITHARDYAVATVMMLGDGPTGDAGEA